MEEDKNNSFGLLQNGEPDLTKSSKRGSNFFESEKEDNRLDSFLKKDEVKLTESKKEGLPNEQGLSFMDSFLVEWVHIVSKTLSPPFIMLQF